MNGSDLTYEGLLAMVADLPPAERAYGRWVMTEHDRDQLHARVSQEGGAICTSLFGWPIELREGEDGIEFVPDEPPRPGVFLDVGDTIEYVHCTDPSCPAVQEGYSHAHRGEVIRSDDQRWHAGSELEPGRSDNP